jgi:putative chitinase
VRLNLSAFAAFAPKALPNTCDALEKAIAAYPALQDPDVLDDWLGQMWVESAGFSTMTEGLNYSVDGLLAAFGRHRISAADAQAFGRIDKIVGGKKIVVRPANQSAIANIIYGGEWGRKNLGNTDAGDGWKFRGSGFKQITGRANITASGFSPEELRTEVYKSALAAAQFFVSHGCVVPAKSGDIEEVTRRVNGGDNGLANRRLKTAEARKVIA